MPRHVQHEARSMVGAHLSVIAWVVAMAATAGMAGLPNTGQNPVNWEGLRADHDLEGLSPGKCMVVMSA